MASLLYCQIKRNYRRLQRLARRLASTSTLLPPVAACFCCWSRLFALLGFQNCREKGYHIMVEKPLNKTLPSDRLFLSQ